MTSFNAVFLFSLSLSISPPHRLECGGRTTSNFTALALNHFSTCNFITLALVCCTQTDTHNSAQRSATALVVTLNVALDDNGGHMDSVQVIVPVVW